MPKAKLPLKLNKDGTYSKFCLTCKTWKSTEEFGIRKGKSDGFCEKCKECYRKAEEVSRRSRGVPPNPFHPPNYEKNNITYKWCLHCKDYLPISSFYTDASRPDGIALYCKEYDKNQKKLQWKDPTFRERKHQYYSQYRKDNLEILREKEKKYRKNNLEKCHLRDKAYRAGKKDNLMYKLNLAMRGGIYKALKENKGGLHWETLIPYTLDSFTCHVLRQLEEGMTLENYGMGEGKWNIDHIRPIASFTFKTKDDVSFQECWQLKNLRPMWSIENTRKNNKRDRELEQRHGLLFSDDL